MSIERVQLASIAGIKGFVRIDFLPEARLHVFEFVEAWEVGHVELGGISGFFITENEALGPSCRISNASFGTASSMVLALRCTEMHVRSRLNRASINTEEHGTKNISSVCPVAAMT